MTQQPVSVADVLLEGSFELVGEIDQQGIDALAELLIADVQRKQQLEEDPMTSDHTDE